MLTDWTISVGKTRLVGLVTEFLISSKSAAAAVGGPVLPFSTIGFLSTFGDNAGDDCLEDTVRKGGGGGIDGEERLQLGTIIGVLFTSLAIIILLYEDFFAA